VRSITRNAVRLSLSLNSCNSKLLGVHGAVISHLCHRAAKPHSALRLRCSWLSFAYQTRYAKSRDALDARRGDPMKKDINMTWQKKKSRNKIIIATRFFIEHLVKRFWWWSLRERSLAYAAKWELFPFVRCFKVAGQNRTCLNIDPYRFPPLGPHLFNDGSPAISHSCEIQSVAIVPTLCWNVAINIARMIR